MEVTVCYRHAAGTQFVSEDESEIIGVESFEIGGYLIPCDAAILQNDGPFLTLTLEAPQDDDTPYMVRAREEIAALRAELSF